jgi:protein-disulfide isomerase
MIVRFLTIVMLALLAFTLAPAPVAVAGGGEKVATVGGRTITETELESHVKAGLIKVDNDRYEVLKNGLDEMIADELLKQEAKARGTTVDALVKAEVTDKVTDPTDDEIQKFYEQVKAQVGGKTLEEVKPQIVQYLKQQRGGARHTAFVDELKGKYKTTVALRPPVVDVAIDGQPAKGSAKAPVTIVIFSDFQCPYCKRAEGTIAEVEKTYGDKIRLVFRDYPLPFHSNAKPAAEAANCAAAQGKFWEYHDKLFANQAALSADDFKKYAQEVGLDQAKFDKCLTDHTYVADIDKDIEAGQEVGVNGTPAFFINGRLLSGAQPFEKFKEVIDEELAAKSAS